MIKIESVEPKLLPFREEVNGERKQRGLQIVKKHQLIMDDMHVAEGEIDAEMIMHVITDLWHLAHARGIDMEGAVEDAKINFDHETGRE